MIECALILMFSIPLLLKIRDYLYKKQNLTKAWYEDHLFIVGLICALTFHSMLFNSEFTAILTIGPWAYINFRLYKYFWKRN